MVAVDLLLMMLWLLIVMCVLRMLRLMAVVVVVEDVKAREFFVRLRDVVMVEWKHVVRNEVDLAVAVSLIVILLLLVFV